MSNTLVTGRDPRINPLPRGVSCLSRLVSVADKPPLCETETQEENKGKKKKNTCFPELHHMLCLISDEEDGKPTFDLLDISEVVRGHESAE